MKISKSTKQEYMKMGLEYLPPQKITNWDLFLDSKDDLIVIPTMLFIRDLGSDQNLDSIKSTYDNMYSMYSGKDEIIKAVLKFSKQGPEFCEMIGDTAGTSIEELEDIKMENEILEEINSERFAADEKKAGAIWIDPYSVRNLDEALAALKSYDERGETAFFDFNGKLLYSSDRLTSEEAIKLEPDMEIVRQRKQDKKERTHSIEEVKEGVAVQRAGSISETMKQAVKEEEKEVEQNKKDEQML